MHINKATLEDIDAIFPLVQHAVKRMNDQGNYQWDKQYPTKAVFINDIQQEHLYLAMHKSSIAGCVCLNLDQPPEYTPLDWSTPKKSLVIHRMVVAPNYLGKGIARMMFEHAANTALKLNYKSIRSDTNQANKAMNHLFNSYKYQLVGNITLRDNPMQFNCYELHITS